MGKDTIIFKSKKDNFIRLLYWTWLIPVSILITLYILEFTKYANLVYLPPQAIYFVFFHAANCLLFWYGFHYKFDNSKYLMIRIYGVTLLKIEINSIVEVSHKHTSSYTWGLAFTNVSLKTKAGKEYNLSPIELPEFIIELLKVNQKIILSEKLKKIVELQHLKEV